MGDRAQAQAEALCRGPSQLGLREEVFYRGGWCPSCNLQLHELAASKGELDKRGIVLVAIGVDKPSEEARKRGSEEARKRGRRVFGRRAGGWRFR